MHEWSHMTTAKTSSVRPAVVTIDRKIFFNFSIECASCGKKVSSSSDGMKNSKIFFVFAVISKLHGSLNFHAINL